MVEKKTVYIARDKTQHSSKQDAESHEDFLDLLEYVDQNRLYPSGQSIDGQEFGLWLKQNPRIYVRLMPDDIPMAGDAHADG